MQQPPEKQSDSQTFLISNKYFACHILLAGTSTKFCQFESLHLQKPINSFFFFQLSALPEKVREREKLQNINIPATEKEYINDFTTPFP